MKAALLLVMTMHEKLVGIIYNVVFDQQHDSVDLVTSYWILVK